ncbi:MAG: DNA-processing protein DprA [Clostridia bacterium]|nr:DNA-processing protein DprA [Clostridia bacterium]
MSDCLYWIWLQNALGFGSNKISEILLKIKSVEDFYHSGLSFWVSLSIFTQSEIFRLSENLDNAKKICAKCDKLGYKIISLESENFPEMLKNTSNPPCVLYISGDFSVLLKKCVSIVGSRNATIYGTQMAYEISRDLAKSGITVVSGGAFGIDSSAHKGAIDAKGNTAAVLACGIDYPYLVKNSSLRENITNFGALVSEYPPGYQVRRFNFPVRNRIISGLSHSTVVIEARKKSGAIITANLAAEQGRDVFVVPVRFENPLSEGVNALIEDGAKVITCAEDILKENFNFQNKNINLNKNNINKISKKLDIPERFKFILDKMGDKKIHIDELRNLTKMPVYKLSVELSKLELKGFVKKFPGKFYKLNIEKFN